MQDALGFPGKQDPAKWSVSELNDIRHRHVEPDRNGCALHTSGCLEWESERYRGVMRARCYPFNIPKRRFHNMNPQVHHTLFNRGCTLHILLLYNYTIVILVRIPGPLGPLPMFS